MPPWSGTGISTLVIGTGPGLETLAGSSRVAVLDDSPSRVPPGMVHVGPIAALDRFLAAGDVTNVALCMAEHQWPMAEELVRTCLARSVEVFIPVVVRPAGAGRARRLLKRTIDVVGAMTGLAALAPLLAAAIVAIVIDDGRPAIFRQFRAGQDGRPFGVYKLRTMTRDADHQRGTLRSSSDVNGAAFKMRVDPRITRVGRWLRRTSIDELPQLINVLKGEMSLVGPRPHPYDDVARYRPWHLRRLSVKPGITGLWQVELRNDPDFDRWVGKDLEYIERWSIRLDLSILARTIPALFRGEGR